MKFRELRIRKNPADGELHDSGFHYISVDGVTITDEVVNIANYCDVVHIPYLNRKPPMDRDSEFGDFSIDIPEGADYIRLFCTHGLIEPRDFICSDFLFNAKEMSIHCKTCKYYSNGICKNKKMEWYNKPQYEGNACVGYREK